MVVTTDIEFDNNPSGTYFAGQMLTGKIVLTADKPKQVKAVALKINGFARTQWQEHRRHHHHRHHHKHHEGREDYIASVTYLLGSDENQLIKIETGIHTYTFACHIPPSCPTSFESSNGYIRYTVRVVLIRPWKFDQVYTKGFTVLKLLDLNYDSPLLRMPTNSDVEKYFCCWPCRMEPLKLNVTLPQSGYVPGQMIPIKVLVTNDSRLPVKELAVRLVMVVTYYSQNPDACSTTSRTTVTKFTADSVMRECRKLFDYQLSVPATPPTCVHLCRLVHITYQVEVEAKMPAMHPNQVVCVPVTIGNVPLIPVAVIEQQPTSSTANVPIEFGTSSATKQKEESASSGTAVAPPLTPGAPWETNAEIPPPNYEEAMYMQHVNIAEDTHDYGQHDFAPRYPVFNVPSPQAPTADEADAALTNKTPVLESSKGSWL